MAGKKGINKQFILDHLDENDVDLSMCNLTVVPVKELKLVTRGIRLDLSRNLFTTLPDNFGILKHLIELDLSSNNLTALPDSTGQLLMLQKLDLYSNKLSVLPLTFWQLSKLKWLDMRNNPLDEELAASAGPCVSEVECKQCASKVLVLMKKRSADHERKRQLELQKKRDLEAKEAAIEAARLEEARRAKAELRQRKKEERLQQEREAVEKKEVEEFERNEEIIKNEPPATRKSGHGGTLCWVLVMVVLLLVTAASWYTYCTTANTTGLLCSYIPADQEWTDQVLAYIGLS